MPQRNASRPSTSTLPPLQQLTITPIEFSLTEGTNIPAPRPETPPETPSEKAQKSKGGPLSSHPITPVDTETNPIDKLNVKTSSNVADGHPFPRDADQASTMAMPPPSQRPRRPSFAERFRRFGRSRSSLALHGGDSTLSLAPSMNTFGSPTTTSSEMRGMKRNAPGVNGTLSMDYQRHHQGSQSQSLPRMIRRKSMELFSKRRSSIFNGMSFDAADEERLREQYEEEARERERRKKPRLPMLPEMHAIGSGIDGGQLGGEEMFAHIGV